MQYIIAMVLSLYSLKWRKRSGAVLIHTWFWYLGRIWLARNEVMIYNINLYVDLWMTHEISVISQRGKRTTNETPAVPEKIPPLPLCMLDTWYHMHVFLFIHAPSLSHTPFYRHICDTQKIGLISSIFHIDLNVHRICCQWIILKPLLSYLVLLRY